jgi:uncharacterized membrane protein YdbT with pleckstrin-like domain
MKPLVLAASLLFVFLPWLVLLVLLANRAVGNYRQWKRTGREMDAGDRDMLRLCYVTLMVAVWLGGW